MKKVLSGPGGVMLEIDPAQHFPDDPGNGTPLLVVKGRATATLTCALGEGELDDGCGGTLSLTDEQLRWLDAQEDDAWDYIEVTQSSGR